MLTRNWVDISSPSCIPAGSLPFDIGRELSWHNKRELSLQPRLLSDARVGWFAWERGRADRQSHPHSGSLQMIVI